MFALDICTIGKHFHFKVDPPYYGEQMARAECLYYGSVHNYHRGTDYMYNNSGFSGTREAVPIVETVHRERLKCILQSLVY